MWSFGLFFVYEILFYTYSKNIRSSFWIYVMFTNVSYSFILLPIVSNIISSNFFWMLLKTKSWSKLINIKFSWTDVIRKSLRLIHKI